MSRRAILFFASVTIVALFFCIPFYHRWLMTNMLRPRISVWYQMNHMTLQERMDMRFGYTYISSTDIANRLQHAGVTNAVILMPPDEYIQQAKVYDFHIPEPLEFYYFTGIKAVDAYSKDVYRCTWTIEPGTSPQLALRRLKSPQDLDNFINLYKTHMTPQ